MLPRLVDAGFAVLPLNIDESLSFSFIVLSHAFSRARAEIVENGHVYPGAIAQPIRRPICQEKTKT